jgi:hypothetical protein
MVFTGKVFERHRIELAPPSLSQSPMLRNLTSIYNSEYIWNTFFHLLEWNSPPLFFVGLELEAFTEICEIDISEQKIKIEKYLSLPIFLFNFLSTLFIRFLVFCVSFVCSLMARLTVNTVHSGDLFQWNTGLYR